MQSSLLKTQEHPCTHTQGPAGSLFHPVTGEVTQPCLKSRPTGLRAGVLVGTWSLSSHFHSPAEGRQDLPLNPNPSRKHRQSQALRAVPVCAGEVNVALCFEKGGMKCSKL